MDPLPALLSSLRKRSPEDVDQEFTVSLLDFSLYCEAGSPAEPVCCRAAAFR